MASQARTILLGGGRGSKRAIFMGTPSVDDMFRIPRCSIDLEWHTTKSDSRRTRSGWLLLHLNIAIWDEEEANDTIATDAIGTLDNIERSGPTSVVWRLGGALGVERKENTLRGEWGITENN